VDEFASMQVLRHSYPTSADPYSGYQVIVRRGSRVRASLGNK
jgi:hypothetical protein